MKNVSIVRVTVVLLVFLLSGHAALSEPIPSPASSATTNSLPPEVSKKIDDSATKMLSESGVPSASIAVVKDGKLAYSKAYGLSDIASHRSATTSMIYSIGSISKQFTAASIFFWPRKANSRSMIPSDAGYPTLHERTKLRSARCSR